MAGDNLHRAEQASLGGPGSPNHAYGSNRLAVYTDYAYHRENGTIYAERAFALFLARFADLFPRLVLVGRLYPEPGRSHYRVPENVDFEPLPYYATVARPWSAALAMAQSIRRFWRVLDNVDVVWLLGPHPLSICFVAVAALRRRRIILGVRQDTPAYARGRHPGRRLIQLAALGIEAVYRTLARVYPVVVVGPALAHKYRRAHRLLPLMVSLIDGDDIVPVSGIERSFNPAKLTVLSVGRLEAEKNPLMLADVLAQLHRRGRHWRLVVCGEGELAADLQRRFDELGLSEYAELRGYVPINGGLRDVYRSSQLFLHVSWTEGFPQVILEAFAAGLPVVATEVGGVARAVEGAALLIPPGDPAAAVERLERIADDAELRTTLVKTGIEFAHAHTTTSECRRLSAFLAGSSKTR